MAGQRSRFGGSAAEMAAILSPFVASRSWLRYSESPVIAKAKTIPTTIAQHHDLLERLYRQQENLSFKETTVRDAFKKVLSDKGGFGMSPGEQKDWVATMSLRLRNTLRAVAQGLLKRPDTPWVKQLPFAGGGDDKKKSVADPIGDEEKEEDQEEEEEEEGEAEEVGSDGDASDGQGRGYLYGFDRETRLAWRSLKAGAQPPSVGRRRRRVGTSDGLLARRIEAPHVGVDERRVDIHETWALISKTGVLGGPAPSDKAQGPSRHEARPRSHHGVGGAVVPAMPSASAAVRSADCSRNGAEGGGFHGCLGKTLRGGQARPSGALRRAGPHVGGEGVEQASAAGPFPKGQRYATGGGDGGQQSQAHQEDESRRG